MSTTGWVLPSARTVDTGSGTWTNDVNILIDDGAEAIFSLTSKNVDGRYLRGQNFGFDTAVPAGSTIDQVQIRMEYRVNSTAGVAQPKIQAFVGGTAVGTERLASPAEPTTLTLNDFDITADRAWTRPDLLDGTFEVLIRGRNGSSTSDPSYRWDYIAAQVTYTEPGVSGTLAATLPAITASSTGAASVGGALSEALPALSATAAGAANVSGSASAALPVLAASLAGAVDTGGVSGTLAATLPPLIATSAGDLRTTGAFGATLLALTSAASGSVEVAGGVGPTLPALGATLAGTVVDDTIRGSAGVALSALAMSALGALTSTGVVAGSLPTLTGQFAATAAAAQTVERPFTGTTLRPGTGSVLAGDGTVTRPDTGTVTRP